MSASPQARHGKAVRHAEAAVRKWRERGLNPPPYLCGYCGEFVGAPTLEEFETALLGHVRQHAPADGPEG
jgi:hypothetical protein